MKFKPFFLLVIIFLIASSISGQPVPATGKSSDYLSGMFNIVWGDGSIQDPQSVIRYFLTPDSGETIELRIESQDDREVSLLELNHQHVFVSGEWLEQGEREVLQVEWLRADSGEAVQPDGVFGPQPWVSIMCKFSDYNDEPQDLDFFREMYSDEYPGLDHFWQEQSFSLANVNGSGAFGWYTLPYPRDHYVPPSGYMDWGAAATDCTAVADADVYFPDYVGINLMFNANLDCCAWGGSWWLTLDGVSQYWRMTWEPPWGYANIGVIGHETGHGFGLPHSSGDYGQVYDNAWDVMSDVWSNGDRGAVDPVYGTMGQHTIAFHKNMLEWIDNEHMIVVPTGTRRTVTLERLALPQTDNPLGIKILINDSQNLFYTVEARQFVGYDSWLPGEAVIVHQVDTFRGEPAHVVDIDRNGNTGDEGAMWRAGETFTDILNGIYVTVEAATETGFIITVENKFFDLDSVEVSGPIEGMHGEIYTFTADVLPINATEPITYVWEATDQLPITHTGGISDQVPYTWLDDGTKSITVTVSNPGSVVSDTVNIDVQAFKAPESVEVDGPHSTLVGYTNTYTAYVQPISATLPITYIWQTGEQETITHTGGITDVAVFSWLEPSEQIINLLAINAFGEVTTTFSTAVILPELGVNMTGTSRGYTGLEYLLTAQVSPITTTVPLTYVWTVDEMPPITHTGGLSDTLAISWDEPGTYLITLQVSNIYTSATMTWEFYVADRIFIPIARK